MATLTIWNLNLALLGVLLVFLCVGCRTNSVTNAIIERKGDCSIISTLPPLVDLGPGQTYNGYEGGLYPGGSNVRPAAHDAAGQKIAQSIVPLDTNGNPDPINGKIVFVPIGISLTNGVWDGGYNTAPGNNSFKARAIADPTTNPQLVLPWTGITGNSAWDTRDPNNSYYATLNSRLASQGITPQQVQIVWLYPFSLEQEGSHAPDQSFPAFALFQQGSWKSSLRAMKQVYPNLKIAYLGTKHHPFNNTAAADPEMHHMAWGVRWVIQDQIDGDPSLNYDPAKGPVAAPWIAWGPYYWAVAGIPRAYDGFLWTCDDVINIDGDFSHPSASGIYKEATLLLNQMKTDPTATPWFLRSGARPPPP